MNTPSVVLALVAGAALAADPLRVVVLDFEDQTGQKADAELGGAVEMKALTQKCVPALARALANQPEFALVDRREFLSQIARETTADGPQVSFLRAAQIVNADLVLRGAIQALSVGKTAVRQGGYNVDFSTLTLRVGIEALDAVDGSIVAAATGAAQKQVRQTENLQTVLGEAELAAMLDEAIAAVLPQLRSVLARRAEVVRSRPIARLNVRTSADPALVEIDGVLVGTTPLENLRVYHGDHTLVVGRAGYRDIRKRIRIDRDLQIEVPMIRTELTADELKEVLDKARVNAIIGEPGLTILPLQ